MGGEIGPLALVGSDTEFSKKDITMVKNIFVSLYCHERLKNL